MTSQDTSSPLWQFFAAYFHQDWSLDDSSFERVIDRFVKDHPHPVELRSLAAQLSSLAAEAGSEEELGERLYDEFGSHYAPAGDGLTARAWLREVAGILAKAADSFET